MNRREIILGAAALSACGSAAQPRLPSHAFRIQRGVNLGNALEAPNEGDWGYRIEADHLSALADVGFDGVRLPVRWAAHTAPTAPYRIDPAFFARVTEVIDQALARGLRVQLDLHHYQELIDAPDQHRQRFLAIWRQIARAYRDMPPTLLFEPLNEPNGPHWRSPRLEDLQADVIAAIREHNAERVIVLGPANWQNINALSEWQAPHDEWVSASVHYYEPHAFTHQNAEWLRPAPTFPRQWGTESDIATVRAHIRTAAEWHARRGGAMQLGEFGVNLAVPIAQRAAWTRTVREACETHRIAWCVWDFAGAFPVWDRDRRNFIPEIVEALGL